MPKKCIICGEEAKYAIKDTSDYYCKECAEESFSDLSMLTKIEEKKEEPIYMKDDDDEKEKAEENYDDDDEEPDDDSEEDFEEE